MAKARIEVGIFTSASLVGKTNGKRLLEVLIESAPHYSPDRYNDHEPINIPFDPSNIDEAIHRAWGFGFLWKRKTPAMEGHVWVGGNDMHSRMYLSLPRKSFDVERVLHLVGAIREAFGVDFGYIHLPVDEEDARDLQYYRRHVMPFSQGATTEDLRAGIPDFCWAMLFGPPYVELFGRERLLTTPAARVEELGDAIYIQLTSDIAHVAGRRDDYLAAQAAAKTHLNSDAFRGMSERCRVPEFLLVAR